MSIQDLINIDIKDAMKAKNVDKLAALRAVKSSIMLEATKSKKSIVNDEISLKLIAKLVKQRKDAADIYIKQERQDLANDEMNQLSYLEVYLPEQMNEDQVRKEIKQVIHQTGASNQSDIGRCIGITIRKIGDKANSSLISKLVKEMLS